MGNIPLYATGRRKITTTLQRGDGALLCALIHSGSMLQSSSRNDDAERTDYPNGFHTHLESEIDKLDARRAELSTKETKQLQALQKQLDECLFPAVAQSAAESIGERW